MWEKEGSGSLKNTLPEQRKSTPVSAFVALSVILKLTDIRSLFAAVALYDFKADGITVIQRFKTVDLNRGLMNENIFPFIGGNESVAFFCIKPFYFTCTHISTSL